MTTPPRGGENPHDKPRRRPTVQQRGEFWHFKRVKGENRPRGRPFFMGMTAPAAAARADDMATPGQPRDSPGAGRGRILPAAEAQTVGQPHRNFREMRGRGSDFSKRQPRGRRDSLGNYKKNGRPRLTRSRPCCTMVLNRRPPQGKPSEKAPDRLQLPGAFFIYDANRSKS